MEEKKDLWNLVRKKLEKNNELEPKSLNIDDKQEIITEDKKEKNIESKEKDSLNFVNKEKETVEEKNVSILNQGIFAGFIYIFTIISLGHYLTTLK